MLRGFELANTLSRLVENLLKSPMLPHKTATISIVKHVPRAPQSFAEERVNITKTKSRPIKGRSSKNQCYSNT